MASKRIALIAAGAWLLAVAGCYRPPWEIRTYVGPADPTAVYTDTAGSGTWQYNMSKVRGRWVCPVCGYSCDAVYDPSNPPNCPNPWNVSGHGNVRLRYQEPSRCFVSATDRPVTDPAGQNVRAVLGKPFHPTTGSERSRSVVHVAVAGLQDNPNVQANDANGDFVRFLFLRPGARFPAARVELSADGIGIGASGVHVNPWRVTDGEVYNVQVYRATDWMWWFGGWVPLGTWTCIRVYSSLDGLVFFGTDWRWGTSAGLGAIRVIAATGSVVLDIPDVPDPTPPAGGPPPWGDRTSNTLVSTFTVHSNTQIIPGLGEDPTADPPDFSTVPPLWQTFFGFCTVQDWPIKHNFFRIPSSGRVADWLNAVIGSGNPVQNPYLVPAGAVGKGWAVAMWQDNAACEGAPGGYNGILDNPFDNVSTTIGGNLWWWEEGAEWNYDWLVEAAGAAAYDHLWANSRAVANGTDLSAIHKPQDIPGHFRTDDPPPFIACAFISSRVQIPPTGDTWVHGSVSEPAEDDSEPETGYAVLMVGESLGGGSYSGSYEPGTRTVNRYADIRNRQVAVLQCPNCHTLIPNLGASSCPYCGAGLSANQRIDGYAVTFLDVDEPPGIDIISPRSLTPDRAVIPDSCIAMGPHGGWWGPGRLNGRFWVAVDLPKYLPPSVPAGANNAINDFDNDPGYRGRLVMFHRAVGLERTPDMSGRRLQTNWRWDAAYRCPACGAWQNQDTAWDFTTGQACANGSCQGTRICPVCAIPFGPSATSCAFCGHSLTTWSASDTFCSLHRVTPADLDCEEYDIFGMIVSVLRKLELGTKLAGLDLGRVAPGVAPGQPDTTTGSTPSARPEPSAISPQAETAVLNEGNVASADLPVATNLNKAEVEADKISPAGQATKNPITVSTLLARDANGNPLSPAAPLDVRAQEPGGAEGHPALAYMTAGWSIGNAYKPVPLGQPAGTHIGTALFFEDLDADGALDFYDASAGAMTDTSSTIFDPVADLPVEPVASMDVRTRVAETPVSDNDYFAGDFWPSLTFGYDNNWDANSLQLVFGSNRPPGASIGAASGHYVAPPASAAEARSRASQAINLFYWSANLVTDPTDPLYRDYAWRNAAGTLEPAHTLTDVSVPGAVNAAPDAMDRRGLDRDWVTLWHRRLPTERGWESTLRLNRTGSTDYSAANETFMFTGRRVAGLRSLFYAGVGWLLWHSGQKGHEQLYFLRDFDPANPRDGQPLAVTNSFGSAPHRERTQVYLDDGSVLPDVHKPARSPFTYTKDACAWGWAEPTAAGGTEPVINVVFAAYVRHEETSDICWVRFREPDIEDPAANWGKKAFPRIHSRVAMNPAEPPGSRIYAGEELQADARRQTFASRHMDWVVHDAGPSDNFGTAPDPVRQDPLLHVAVVTDTPADWQPPAVSIYRITWSHGDNRWNRARNAYFVEPRFQLIDGPDVLAPRAYPGDPPPYRLVDPPTAPQPSPRPLMMEIDIAAGRVRFSSPLFDTTAPDYDNAVVNTAVVPNAVDVQMYADYTPLVWRITRSPSNDDCPWAYWEPSLNGALSVFWRRTYSLADAPHWGRSVFLYKLWAPSVQVLKPPISGNPTVEDWAGSPLPAGSYQVFSANGIIWLRSLRVADAPFGVRITYNSPSGTVTEEHIAVGWTEERRVPVETELAVGPFTVRPERYTLTVGGNPVPAIKFWLTWTSPRALLDLRPVANGGGGIRQSADVYVATVIPDLNSAVAEPVRSSISGEPT